MGQISPPSKVPALVTDPRAMPESHTRQTVDVAIALGSNLGDSLAILEAALLALDEHADIALLSHSSWYKTAPVGPPQPDYLNGWN